MATRVAVPGSRMRSPTRRLGCALVQATMVVVMRTAMMMVMRAAMVVHMARRRDMHTGRRRAWTHHNGRTD